MKHPRIRDCNLPTDSARGKEDRIGSGEELATAEPWQAGRIIWEGDTEGGRSFRQGSKMQNGKMARHRLTWFSAITRFFRTPSGVFQIFNILKNNPGWRFIKITIFWAPSQEF